MPAIPATVARKRILLLEDCADDAELLAIELESAGLGHELKRVATESEFLAALSDYRPQLVISDSNLPGFSGMQTLRAVRDQAPGVPFIFLTGNPEDHPDTPAARQAADGYLSKDAMQRTSAFIARLLPD